MQIDKIKEIISLVNETDINVLELETDGIKLKLQKSITENNIDKIKLATASESDSNEKTEEKIAVVENENIKYTEVKSPIVGTFYSAPNQDSQPFVKVGDRVKKGDILCIIEAMKVMNEIEAEVDGEIVQILVENESMVEYGQVLIKIK
ncbi:acetyl-CoA carboxylase biotin carboxyl carrier protein [Abyssisolibacter fermentans]|uniref:acetyl-CoA carboxylase biotin carboxyl carrier protein n=1 Tax=Abyssisolibacter fermentans TaxID=1766203 RepID=UPI00082E9E8A|nr:acetyl-CoA carboxylase biotin carboxyl carrier protein [Abyssisolibacter fermentans]